MTFNFHHDGTRLLSRLFQADFQAYAKCLGVCDRHGRAGATRHFCRQVGNSAQRRAEGYVRHSNSLAGNEGNAEHGRDPLLFPFAKPCDLLEDFFRQRLCIACSLVPRGWLGNVTDGRQNASSDEGMSERRIRRPPPGSFAD